MSEGYTAKSTPSLHLTQPHTLMTAEFSGTTAMNKIYLEAELLVSGSDVVSIQTKPTWLQNGPILKKNLSCLFLSYCNMKCDMK